MNTLVPDQLITDRLVLRELNPYIYKNVMTTLEDEALTKYFGFDTDEQLRYEEERFSQGLTMAGRSFLYFHLIDKVTDKVMGWCGYHTWFLKHQRAEIGYQLNRDEFKNKGFMKEAMGPILRYGFDAMNLHRIEALLAMYNIPSLKLVQHFGFSKEGLLREHYNVDGVMEDSVIFSLLHHEM